jgi:hypothetical protein
VADDGECENFHRSARAPPATRRHAGHISAIKAPQVTASLHDFAVSLPPSPTITSLGINEVAVRWRGDVLEQGGND